MGGLKILGSSSKGNCYLLQCTGETLIIELGISWKKVIKGLDYNMYSVVGALCSHRHGDHAAHVKDALNAGITVVSNSDVQSIHKDVTVAKIGSKVALGGFIVQPFELEHDVECYGYLIDHKEVGRLVFITDTCSVKYRFKGIHHFLVEANYSDDIMNQRFSNSNVDIDSKMRLDESHLSLEKAIDFINHSKDDNAQSVLLLHLSDRNSDAMGFIGETRLKTDIIDVKVADSGMNIRLDTEGFF